MTCEPADRQGCGGRGRGRGSEARSPFCHWAKGSAQRPDSAAPRGRRSGPARGDPRGPAGLQRERETAAPPSWGPWAPPKAFPCARPAPCPSSPTLLFLAGGGGSESCAENLARLGEKSETCNRPGPGEGRAGRRGEQENIGALFPFPGRDMINRFLLI